MPFHQYISTTFGATIALWQLTENKRELALLLSEETRNEITTETISSKRFCERAATRLLLNEIKETHEARIAYTPEGRPYMTDRLGYISISHTKGWVAVAYHPTVPIGIDIELLGDKVGKVAPRVFNAKELTAYASDALRNAQWLHLCWSAKEALFKAIPESGIDFREHLHVSAPPSLDNEGLFTARESRTLAAKEYTLWYRIFDTFVAVCAVPLQ